MSEIEQLDLLEQILKLRRLHFEMRDTIARIDNLALPSIKEGVAIQSLRNLIYADRVTVHTTGNGKFWIDGIEILAGLK